MGVEAYFVAPDAGPRRLVADYVRRLTASGYPCREQEDECGHWVVFDGLESTLNFTVEDGAPAFVTFDMMVSSSDPPEFFDTVERVFVEVGWDTGRGDDG